MELTRDNWTKEDILEFQDYLRTFEDPKRREWCTNILQTKMPVLCLKTAAYKNIVSKICKGNYLAFLDYMLWEYYENTSINGAIISQIKDFDIKKKYLDIYSSKADNWATCDLLKFDVPGNEEKYYNLVLEYIASDKPFVRRIGMYVLFDFINDEYIQRIFMLLDRFTAEKDYYVNMMNAWLLCECFIRQRSKTLEYLANHQLNKFTINKAIQKCRDSHRVSLEDKDLLTKYRSK